MLNRTTAPLIKNIEQFIIPCPEKLILPNNIDLFMINMGDTDVLRIDFIFGSGKWDQVKNLTAIFTNQLLKEGAGDLSSQKIAEHLDFHGAWLQSSATQHNSYITLYILNKHIDKLIPTLDAIIKSPAFPKDEFSTIIERHKQQFKIDKEKVDYLCLYTSLNQLYGDNHPYGKQAVSEDFDRIDTADLKQFHRNHYHSGNCKIMLTGKLNEANKQLIIEYFGTSEWGTPTFQQEAHYTATLSSEKTKKITKPDAVQSAVRIAAPCIDRDHEDYQGLKVLNTVFGGYFGSRLMTSIREDKGYTYGIGSSISTQQQGSSFSISTQTGSEYVEPLIEAVFDEMKKLQDNRIDRDELECVRNYLLGDFTRTFDGPFAIADAHISLLANNLKSEYFKNQFETIQNIEAEELQKLAQKYFNKEQFYLAIAGK